MKRISVSSRVTLLRTAALRVLAFQLALLGAFSPPAAFAADEYYKLDTPDGVNINSATPYPMSNNDALNVCRKTWTLYSFDTVVMTPYAAGSSGAPWLRITCGLSTKPTFHTTLERSLLARCPSGTHPYANYGFSTPGGQALYASWGWANDLGENAFWCASPCKKGETKIGGTCQRDANLGGTCPATGHPISMGPGNKFLRESDYVGTGPLPLAFRRYYNSRANSMDYSASQISPWRHEYQRRVDAFKTQQNVAWFTVDRPDGRTSTFEQSGSAIIPRYADTKDVLERLTDTGGTLTGWRFKDAKTDEVELYDVNGQLQSITNRAGATLTLTYSTPQTPLTIARYSGFLIKVTDQFGRALNFSYDMNGRMVRMTDPSGGVYTYAYNDAKNSKLVTSVTFPDNRSKRYVYNEAAFVQGGAFGLTSTFGEDGQLFATYKYAAQGMAVEEVIGGIARTTLAYGGTSTTVTDPLNTPRVYAFQNILGVTRMTSQSQPGGAGCGPAAQGLGYDTNGNVTSRTDFDGKQTTYTFDSSRNLETSRTEAAGTPKARTITTQWHPTYRLPIRIDEPGRRTTYTHDLAGSVLTSTVLDTTTSASRTTSYTYNITGQVLTIDGPRTDANDVTTFTYYNCTTGYQCGQLQTITDALNHTTTFNAYNAHGQPLTITDANGAVTTVTYDVRQRLLTRTVGGELTSFDYWPTGLLKKVTVADGSYLNYLYDAAYRLTEISDSQGNRAVYTLDTMGNRIAEYVYDPSNVLTRTHSRVFDGLSRLWKDLAASGTAAQTTVLGYDPNGNQTTVNAPMSRNSVNGYDELNRLTNVIDGNNGTTQLGYNALDQLISVTDPRSLQTTYQYNALDDLTQQVSPDTGATINTYDSSGNLKTTTDSRNKTATYTYDALNRVTQEFYPDQTLTYAYDAGANAVGRISSVTDSSGSTSWTYTPQGRIATKTQITGTMVKTVQYGYNAAGQLVTMITPSNKTIAYGYANNQIASMTVNSANLLSNVLYEPFGPTSGWTWGNGTLAVRVYDGDGNLTQLDSAGVKTIGYDDALRITSVTDQDNGVNSWSYGYDTLDRLTSAIGSQTQSFTFDNNGNRLTQGGTINTALTVSSSNNRLNAVSGAITKSYSYDNAGNTTSDGTATYTYSDAGRMASVTKSGMTTTYTYNALGQRVTKTTGGSTTFFVYDEAGHILGEYDTAGGLIQETAWMDDTPVASIRVGSSGLEVFYIHTDHLDTPRRITRPSTNEIVWRWESDPFGTTPANENPNGLGTFAFNLRFAGQYFDSETGTHYNYFRDYDPTTGRYVESDPIGLAAGVNTYAYVYGNSIALNDPYGLFSVTDLPTLPQGLVDFSAGFGDTLSFGLTNVIRNKLGTNSAVNKCSGIYTVGELSGLALSIAIGGAAGLEAAGTKGAGKEFSHWIPNRMGGPRSLWNGNFTSAAEHALSDPYRYRFMSRIWKAKNPLPNPLSQQWVRIPKLYKGAGAGGAYGTIAAAVNGDCACQH